MIELKENERIDYIYNKHLKIIQDKTAFTYSLDTLLLADKAKTAIRDKSKVADLCAGNAAASIYLSEFNRAKYDAVEIQNDIVSQAIRSIELNHLENRINVHELNVLDSLKVLKKDSYDVVLVNPPYFKVVEGHHINPDRKKAIARHEVLINLEQIIEIASQLLKMKGKFFIVHRSERLGEIAYFCLKNNLSVKEIQPYCGQEDQDANLVVVECVKNTGTDGLVLKKPIIINKKDGQYTDEIAKIAWNNIDENKEKYYFYVLLCNDGSFYGGFTNDLLHRLAMHNQGKGAKYTKSRRPVQMIYHEEFDDKNLALKREYWFKHHTRKWKEEFLTKHNVKF